MTRAPYVHDSDEKVQFHHCQKLYQHFQCRVKHSEHAGSRLISTGLPGGGNCSALRLNQPCFSPRFRALAPFSALSAIHAVKQFCFNYFSAPPRETSPSFRFFSGFSLWLRLCRAASPCPRVIFLRIKFPLHVPFLLPFPFPSTSSPCASRLSFRVSR